MHRIQSNGWPYYECDKKIRMCILQSFKLSTQFIIEMYLFFIDHLNCLLGSTSPYAMQSQVGKERRYKAIKHFSNTFPVYKLLYIQINVDTDTRLRRSF